MPPEQPQAQAVLFHFKNNLGRPSVYDYPGWFRSFTFVATYAQAYQFEKIVHIESDPYLYILEGTNIVMTSRTIGDVPGPTT